jgi:hypothetical protein
MVRSEVLHEDKGHAGITLGGHPGEKSLEGRKASGGSTDADNWESGGSAFLRQRTFEYLDFG